MDKKKLAQFIFHALSSGHDVDEVSNFVSSQLPKLTSDNPSVPSTFNPSGMGGVASNALALIKKYFPADQIQNAYNVMKGESGGRADAVGDNYPIDTGNGPETIPSYGLFQIRGLPGRPAPQQLVDPEFNVKYAADLYKHSGWNPWSAARKLGLVAKG